MKDPLSDPMAVMHSSPISDDFQTAPLKPDTDVDFQIMSVNPAHDKSFEKMFNIDLNVTLGKNIIAGEVPSVLFELHENSLLNMDREEWERALMLLQKA